MNKNDKYVKELLEGWISIALNLILVILKFIIFILTSSISILADLIHSLTDMLTSVIVIISAKISIKEADEKHPFGHGRAESIAAIVISIIIILAGCEFIYQSVDRLINKINPSINIISIYLLSFSLFIKIINVLLTASINKKTDSQIIKADLAHHYSDVLSTLIVITGFIFSYFGMQYGDNIAGMLVAVFIIHLGIDIFKDAAHKILGESPSPELISKIRDIVFKTDKRIFNIHDLIINNYANYYIISLHIELPADLKFIEAHDVADKVENVLSNRLNSEVIVHIDPILNRSKIYKDVNKILKQFISKNKKIKSYHDLRIVGGKSKKQIIFDIVFNKGVSKKEEEQTISLLKKKLKEGCRYKTEIFVKPEPLYSN